jgi:uncharacterized protein YdaU (DUF1376 family)
MAEKLPYMPFYPRDFRADAKVAGMCNRERGAYIMLLCIAWEYGGILPDNDAQLARWADETPASWARMKPAVMAAFTHEPDGTWHQKRMKKEWAKAEGKSAAAARAAHTRWAGGADAHANADADASRTQCGGDATQTQKQTQTHSPPPDLRRVLSGLGVRQAAAVSRLWGLTAEEIQTEWADIENNPAVTDKPAVLAARLKAKRNIGTKGGGVAAELNRVLAGAARRAV